MFILFDPTAARSAAGDHIKNPEVATIAEQKREEQGTKKKGTRMGHATVKPTLDEELAKFKAIVRHITKHEANHQQAEWFKAESRLKLRRLASLGIRVPTRCCCILQGHR